MCSKSQQEKHDAQKQEIEKIKTELDAEPSSEELKRRLKSRFSKIQAKNKAIKQHVEITNQRLDEVNDSIQQLDNSISTLQDEVNFLIGEIA